MTDQSTTGRKTTVRDIPVTMKEFYIISYSAFGVLGLLYAVLITPIAFGLTAAFIVGETLFPDTEPTDQEKVEAAKKRSSQIDHWSELKDNDE